MTIRPRLLTRVALTAAPVLLAASAVFSVSEGLIVGAIVQAVIATSMAIYGWSLWRTWVEIAGGHLRVHTVRGWTTDLRLDDLTRVAMSSRISGSLLTLSTTQARLVRDARLRPPRVEGVVSFSSFEYPLRAMYRVLAPELRARPDVEVDERVRRRIERANR